MKVYGSPDAWYYFLNDHLGTPQKVVDSAGAVVWATGYLPFGEAQLVTADVENNLRFPGQYYDAETGLHYNWHRYYDPETGRYLTPDPIGLSGGINLYTYALNNPINMVDPDGLEAGTITASTVASGGTTGAITIGAGGVLGIVAGLVLGLPSETAGPDLDMLPPYLEARGRGKQSPRNWATEQAKAEAQRLGKDPCDILNEMYENECNSKKKTGY